MPGHFVQNFSLPEPERTVQMFSLRVLVQNGTILVRGLHGRSGRGRRDVPNVPQRSHNS
jgi:hypothetical protein